jgi:hypothetical protein
MKIEREFVSTAAHCGVKVYLDGVQRSRVVAADEEGRTIQILRHDGQGYVLNAARDDVEVDTLHGDVRIEWRSEADRVKFERIVANEERRGRGGPLPAGRTWGGREGAEGFTPSDGRTIAVP